LKEPKVVSQTFPKVPSLEELEAFVEQVWKPIGDLSGLTAGSIPFCLMQAFPSLAKMSFQLVKDQEVFQSQQQWLSYVSGALEVLKVAQNKVPQREIFIAVSRGELVDHFWRLVKARLCRSGACKKHLAVSRRRRACHGWASRVPRKWQRLGLPLC
jgi:hypothetical protein